MIAWIILAGVWLVSGIAAYCAVWLADRAAERSWSGADHAEALAFAALGPAALAFLALALLTLWLNRPGDEEDGP